MDDQSGDASLDSVLSVVPDDYEVANNPQNRDWPAIDVDSKIIHILYGKTRSNHWNYTINNLRFTTR